MSGKYYVAYDRFRGVSDNLAAAHWCAQENKAYHVGVARGRLLQSLADGRSGTYPKQSREILVELIDAAIRHHPHIPQGEPYSVAEYILDEILDKCLPLPEKSG